VHTSIVRSKSIYCLEYAYSWDSLYFMCSGSCMQPVELFQWWSIWSCVFRICMSWFWQLVFMECKCTL